MGETGRKIIIHSRSPSAAGLFTSAPVLSSSERNFYVAGVGLPLRVSMALIIGPVVPSTPTPEGNRTVIAIFAAVRAAAAFPPSFRLRAPGHSTPRLSARWRRGRSGSPLGRVKPQKAPRGQERGGRRKKKKREGGKQDQMRQTNTKNNKLTTQRSIS